MADEEPHVDDTWLRETANDGNRHDDIRKLAMILYTVLGHIDDLDEKLNHIYDHLVGKDTIPGFRKRDG